MTDAFNDLARRVADRFRLTGTGDLRDRGAIVTDVLCVIDRSGGDHAQLDASSLRVRALFTDADLGS